MSATNRHFDKVVVENAGGKREKFGLYHDVNTSMDFGELQPLCCRLLVPGSKTTMSARHLVRLDPMVAPTFGRMKQKTWHHFVGMSELTRKFSAFLSKELVTGATNTQFFTPTTLPYMSVCDISALCLIGADYSVYFWDDSSSTSPDDVSSRWILPNNSLTADPIPKIIAWLGTLYNGSFTYPVAFPGFTGGAVDLHTFLGAQFRAGSWLPCGRTNISSFLHRNGNGVPFTTSSSDAWSEVPLNGCDYVVRNRFEDSANPGSFIEVAVAIRLSAMGKRIRKILIGCGYGEPNFLSDADRSILPLFAFYKAYFDSFGLTLYRSWESSYAKLCLERYDNDVDVNFNIVYSTTTGALFLRFVYDLACCYYTEDYDYVSAHTFQDAGTPGYYGQVDKDKRRGFLNNIVLDTPAGASGTGVSGIGQNLGLSGIMDDTRHVYINRLDHTEVDSKLLKLLYKWTNRTTAAGRRIAELLRAGGFGKYVDEQKSNFIGYEDLDIEVTDINATADSSNSVVGANSVLGEYVGKGIGVTKGDPKTFSFENDEFGYWITLSCISPESGYCQGEDLLNSCLSADDFYSRDFDAIGQELEPKSLVMTGTTWQNSLNSSEEGWYNESFGMVPRHTKWKVKQNICNGDMSLASTRAGNLPFIFDKWISAGNRDCVDVTPAASVGGMFIYRAVRDLGVTALPVASDAWRFLNRYPWLNNFSRIFADLGSDVDRFQALLHGALSVGTYEYTHYGKDHFNVFNALDMVTYAPMKPISESYGTFDEDKPVPDKTMSRA